jgi:hypothetical protein
MTPRRKRSPDHPREIIKSRRAELDTALGALIAAERREAVSRALYELHGKILFLDDIGDLETRQKIGQQIEAWRREGKFAK